MRVLCFVFGWLFAAAAYAQTQASERLFLVHPALGPAWRAEVPASAQRGFGEHSVNLARLRGSGRLLVGARQADKGMPVVRATDLVAVEREFAADPLGAGGRREHREHWMRPGGGTMLGMARTRRSTASRARTRR